MFLTHANLPAYLVARGLTSVETIVDGQFTAVESRRRNRNFKVFTEPGTGLFVKQVTAAHSDAVGTLAREAACGDLARRSPRFAALRRLAPRMLDHDPARHAIVFRLLPGSENLNERRQRLGALEPEIGRLLGAGLGAYHAAAPEMLARPDELVAFPRQVPWVLTVARCAEQVAPTMSEGNQQVLGAIVRTPGCAAALAGLAAVWRQDCLVHGDIKWDNLLVFEPEEGNLDFRIIDWELADVGDAAWDVGGALAAYLQHWTVSMTVAHPGATIQDMVDRAPVRLESLVPVIAAFWRAYCDAAGIAPPVTGDVLRRCVQYAGARLVQTAFELQWSVPRLMPVAVMCLQLALNVMREPEVAAAELLGLSPAAARPSEARVR